MFNLYKKFAVIIFMLLLCPVNADARCKYNNNCICYQRELENDLKVDSPPLWKNYTFFSNAHNISQALYPFDSTPAKVVNVEIDIYNSSNNSTRKMSYVWSISCRYTILRSRLLLAIVSLGTICPKETTLQVSVREFCKDVPDNTRNTYLKNAISSVSILLNRFLL